MNDETRTVSKETMDHYCRGLAILEGIVSEIEGFGELTRNSDVIQKAIAWKERDDARWGKVPAVQR